MSYKHYVTYICCVILNNIQIHFKASRKEKKCCLLESKWKIKYDLLHPGHIYTFINQLFLAIYCCVCTIQWHHLDSTLRRGARGSSLFWWDFSSSDLGLSRSCPRAACFLFKMYGCVNVCVCTYNPTSIGSLFLFSFCFQL